MDTLPSQWLPKDLAALPPLQRLVRVAGNQSRLAEQLGVQRATVSAWLKRRHVPHTQVERLLALYPDVAHSFEFTLWSKGVDDTRAAMFREARRINAERELAEASGRAA